MKTERKQPEELLPLTPPVFHILLSLANGERHGYAIMQDVAAQTDDVLQLGPGTLYGCLKRMLQAGLVAPTTERVDPELDDERRRYYTITNFGSKVVRAEAQRLERAVNEARSRTLLPHRKHASSALEVLG
jgi:DNA-binding PadR family transcriptional regulator